MWVLLPQVVLQRALERFHTFAFLSPAVRELLRAAICATSSSLRVQHDQRQQLADQQQQVSGLQQHVEDLQQQVSGLQAGMAAVLRHLQLQQPSGQQQAQQP